MITVFSGTDRAAKKNALAELLKSHSDRQVLYFDAENFDQGTFLNAISGGDMFSQKYVAVLRDISLEDSFGITDKLANMADSETVFVILENSLLKAETELLKPHAKVWKTVDLPKGREEKFNIFSITDAFGARDKKSTWVLLQKALRSGVASEEVLNILIWQTKNLLASQRVSMPETGLSPFVYNKAKSYSKNFKEEELQNMSRNLATLFHESHLGQDLGPNLELFLLKTL